MRSIIPCKVCGGASIFFTSVDSSQHCNKQIDTILPQSGVEVDYYRCSDCEFIFTRYIDDFSNDDLIKYIYNDDYVKFDPLYPKIRPQINARFLESIVSEACSPAGCPRILDYGAGNGMLSQILRGRFLVENYDALNPSFNRLPEAKFDIVFCAEVVEHVPTPNSLLEDWAHLLSDTGCVIFSTNTPPDDIVNIRGKWWYMGPRNGHVSLFSRKSLQVLCGKHDLHCESIDDQWHFAFRDRHHAVDIGALRRSVDQLPKGFILV